MLRIILHHDDMQCRLELAGKLAGPWVAETEKVWRSAPCSFKEIEIDMRQVTGVDNAGRALLVVMREAGARFVAQGVAMTALIEEIGGSQLFNGAKRWRGSKNLMNENSRIRRETK